MIRAVLFYVGIYSTVLCCVVGDVGSGRESGANSRAETDTEATTELDVQSETSDDTNVEETTPRPTIEDRLGRHSDTDEINSAKSLTNR